MASAKIKVAILTNVPAPYRVPVWRKVAESLDIDLVLIFCAKPHIDTHTNIQDYGFNMHFLTGRYLIMQRRFMHIDLRVWPLLNRLQPDVLITTGFIPTFLFGFLWALKHKVVHIAMTDGTKASEQVLTRVHRLVRRFVFNHSAAFIGACEGSRALFKQYQIADQNIHLAYLCVNNEKFVLPSQSKQADFIFCGRLIEHKRPLFVLQIAQAVALRLERKIVVYFVGKGLLEPALRSYAEQIAEHVDCHFLGYASQDALPHYYAAAKIHLFPSEWDPWGVVANEACAAGVPTIVSPYPGAVTELLLDGYNAYVRELQLELWVEAAVSLLSDAKLYQQFSDNCRNIVAKYNFDNSAQGLLSAIRQAYPHTR